MRTTFEKYPDGAFVIIPAIGVSIKPLIVMFVFGFWELTIHLRNSEW